jgi:hypothetical protein
MGSGGYCDLAEARAVALLAYIRRRGRVPIDGDGQRRIRRDLGLLPRQTWAAAEYLATIGELRTVVVGERLLLERA